jgi:hypothetical protein
MVRMGHDSERAALTYLHSSRERQRALAKVPTAAKPSGTRRARNRRSSAGTGK